LAKKPAAFFYSGRETEHLCSACSSELPMMIDVIAGLYSAAKKQSKKSMTAKHWFVYLGSDAFLCSGVSVKNWIAVCLVLCRMSL
jgi:hypothetical protein